MTPLSVFILRFINSIPCRKVLDGELRSVIAIKQPPDGGHKDIGIIENREAKFIEISNLVSVIINADLTLNATDNNEKRKDGFFHEVKVMSQTAKSNIHVIIGLGKHINTCAIMTVQFKKLDSLWREVLEFPIIIFDGGFIDDDFTILNLEAAKVSFRIQSVGTQDRDIGENGQRCFCIAKENLNETVIREFLFQTITERLSGSEFCKMCSVGSFTRAGDTEEDTDYRGIIEFTTGKKYMAEEDNEGD